MALDLLKNINGAIKYIEKNLTDEIDFKEVARRALCSSTISKECFPFSPASRYRNISAVEGLR